MKETKIKCDICYNIIEDSYVSLELVDLSIVREIYDICPECAKKIRILCGGLKSTDDGDVILVETKNDYSYAFVLGLFQQELEYLRKENADLKSENEKLKNGSIEIKYIPYLVYPYQYTKPIITWSNNRASNVYSTVSSCCDGK